MKTLRQFPLIERILYSEEDIFHWREEQRADFQLQVIKEAFCFHYDQCCLFRNFCQSQGAVPASIASLEDIPRIPLIPTSAFKSVEIRSVAEDQIVKVCCSSGTQGSISKVPRDNRSLERFTGSIRLSAEQLLEPRSDAMVLNLGPDTEEAGDIWLPYVMGVLGLLRPAENYVIEDTFYVRSLSEDLMELPSTTQAFVVGPPVFFVYLLKFLEEERIRLDRGSSAFIITVGGWKNALSEQIDRTEFMSQCMSRLGLNGVSSIRDAYNMVELNTVIFECEYGAKHIPPWLIVEALDPEQLNSVTSGHTGLLAFYDALPTSYPGFVLSDDFGAVSKEPCSCGRSGPTMEFHRRVAVVEDRGCALRLDKETRAVERKARIARKTKESGVA